MRRQLFSLFCLLCLTLPATAQLVDYRGLGTNGFYTNGFIVNSKHWTNSVGTLTTPTNYNLFLDHFAIANNTAALFSIDPTGAATSDNSYGLAGYNSMFPNAAIGVMNNIKGQVGTVGGSVLYGAKTNGEAAGLVGLTESAYSLGIGTVGTSLGQATTTNIGVSGSAQGLGTNVGGYFEIRSAKSSANREFAESSAITADAGDIGSWVFVGRTNGAPVFRIRADGSVFATKDGDILGNATDWSSSYYDHIAITESNHLDYWSSTLGTIGNANFDYFGYIRMLTRADEDGSGCFASIELPAQLTNGNTSNVKIISDASGTSQPFTYRRNGTYRFKIDEVGDLSLIKSITYSFPTTNGAASQILTTDGGSPQQLYWSTPSSGGITNSGVGPGTNNYLAKFVNPTNVQNAPMLSAFSNSFEMFLRADGGTATNSGTNRMYGEWTNAGTNQWLEIVSPQGHNNEVAHIRHRAIGQTLQRAPIYWNDAVSVEPGDNALSGHAIGALLPLLGSSGAGVQTLGTTSLPWQDVWATRIHGTTGLNSGPQFGSGVGGTGFGLTTDNTMLQFFRDTGITAAFNKTYGLFMFDVAGNYIGFGTGISNCIAFLSTSTLAGLVQVGTNSAVAAPAAAGIMGAQGSGTDKSGSDLRIVGGPSTGVGTNGSVRIQTSEPALSTSTSLNSGFYDRLYVCAKPKVLTTNSATIVFNVTIPTADRMLGGEVMATTKISDGVDQASVRERFAFTAIRKGSTVTTAISASAPMATLATGSAVLTTTWTAVANAQSVDIKCNAVTSGILSTNTFTRWSVELDSDAVPVIAP